MRVTWVIAALRAFAKWFRSGARRSRSSVSPPTTDPWSESSRAVLDEADTGRKHPTADDIPSGSLDRDNGASKEEPESGQIEDENEITEPRTSTPEPPSDSAPPEQGSPSSSSDPTKQPQFPSTEVGPEDPIATAPLVDDDQGHSLSEPVGHSEEGDAGGTNYGTTSAERPPGSRHKPLEIGGRRDRQSPNRTPNPRSQSRPSRPELICRRSPGSRTWEIILTADEECQLSAVHLDGTPLDHTALGYPVPSLTGHLTVSCQDRQEHDIPLCNDDPLIFKLRKNWLGDGRKISKITNGYFIVVAPTTWERIGRAPVEPDACTDIAFRAHYFHRDATATDEILDGFREWNNSPSALGIELTGRRVFDDSDEGDLFVGNAPSMKSSPDFVWARVGEETEHGWAQNFLPEEQSLPVVLDGREGRFFLRAYDSQVRLVDSTSFRYMCGLKQIRVNGADYSRDVVVVPTSTGHSPTEVRFVGSDGSMISPIRTPEGLLCPVPSGPLVVPPRPDADHISCTLATDASSVNIVLDIPRIWWRLEHSQCVSDEWLDKPLVMTRQEFRKHARSNMSMALLSRRLGSVRVGFNDEPGQRYRRMIEDDHIAIPLAHFVDYAQIDRRLNDDAHFNVEWAGETLPIIVVSADPIPEICSFTAEPATILVGEEALLEWTTCDAGDARVSIGPDASVVDGSGTLTIRPSETTRYTLTLTVNGIADISATVTVSVEQLPAPGERTTVQVKSNGGGWRSGKGFSFRELQDAGLTVKETVRRSIPFDRRRRTSHRTNVERVRSLLDG